jgi:predicted DNA-binding transcriptional regulator AlpA
MSGQPFMTVSDVAAYLSINENAVWLFSQTGDIPKPIDHNGSVVWQRSDIEAHQPKT